MTTGVSVCMYVSERERGETERGERKTGGGRMKILNGTFWCKK